MTQRKTKCAAPKGQHCVFDYLSMHRCIDRSTNNACLSWTLQTCMCVKAYYRVGHELVSILKGHKNKTIRFIQKNI